ncbi:hypothetical protein ACYOEI_36580, partial [Singulisphaera rosea]
EPPRRGHRHKGVETLKPFPDDITMFLNNNVESIDQLELLRVLGEDPDREWDAPALAEAVQADLRAVLAHLAAMQARGLLASASSGAYPSYHAGARTAELDAKVRRLLRIYKSYPVTTIRKVYDQAKDPHRDFADKSGKKQPD